MKRYIEHIIESTEKRTVAFLKSQIQDRQMPGFGGMAGDIIDVKPTVYHLSGALSLYLLKENRFYADANLLEAMEKALDFIRRYQREDGSFDFPSCNFHSAPDTAFCFKRLIAMYQLLERESKGAAGEGGQADLGNLMEKLVMLLKESLKAIRDGGFHTPNHRWAIAASLMQGVRLFQEDQAFASSLEKRALEYLQEGIDGNEDGEYAERSTGNYNAVVNQALMTLYQETGEEAYLDYVERNLQMMLTYIDPDDTIFTQNSTRQDKGKAMHPDQYFYQYLYMAAKRNIPEFDQAAHKIIRDNVKRGDVAPDCLYVLLLNEQMMTYEFEGYGFLAEYRKYFKDSGVVRVKRAQYTYSILKDKQEFLFIKFGGLQLYFRIGESYCDVRNFVPQEMAVSANGCRLRAKVGGWYYQPFADKPETNDWWKMDHGKRERLISSSLETEVEVREKESGIEIHIRTEGLDRLPLRAEVGVPGGCILDSENFSIKAEEGKGMLLKDGFLTVCDGEAKVKIGPGCGEHKFGGHYSETAAGVDFVVGMNAYTPCDMVLTVEKV